MIRDAIMRELARRAVAGEQPANPNQLAKAMRIIPQTMYRMLTRPHYGFRVDVADRILTKLGLEVRRRSQVDGSTESKA